MTIALGLVPRWVGPGNEPATSNTGRNCSGLTSIDFLDQGAKIIMQVQEFAGETTRLVATGVDVRLASGDYYALTNHFITTSQPFVKDKKLRRFWRFRFMQFLFALHFLFVLPCFFAWIYACLASVLTILWLLLLLQHVMVLLFTLPTVLKQPVLSNTTQRSLNEFYDFQIERIEGAFLIAQNAGLCLRERNSQTIKFQAFNERGYQIMVNTKHRSRLMFVISLILLVWSLSWAVGETATPYIMTYLNINGSLPFCWFAFAHC